MLLGHEKSHVLPRARRRWIRFINASGFMSAVSATSSTAAVWMSPLGGRSPFARMRCRSALLDRLAMTVFAVIVPELTGDAEDQGKSGGDKEQAGRGGETVDGLKRKPFPVHCRTISEPGNSVIVDALVCASASGSSASAGSR